MEQINDEGRNLYEYSLGHLYLNLSAKDKVLG